MTKETIEDIKRDIKNSMINDLTKRYEAETGIYALSEWHFMTIYAPDYVKWLEDQVEDES